MRRNTLCLAALLALAATHTLCAQTERKAKVEPAEWAPADAIFYLGVTDVERTWEQFKKTGAYELMNDTTAKEAMKGLDIMQAIFNDLREKLAETLDVPPDQLRNPFGGPLVLYGAVPPGGNMEDMRPGLVAGVGDAALMKQYCDTIVSKLKEAGKVEDETVDGEIIHVFTADPTKLEGDTEGDLDDFDDFEDDMGGGMPMSPFGESPDQIVKEALDELFSSDAMPSELAMCLTKERVILGASSDDVRAALKRGKGGESLAGRDDHKALLRHMKRIGTVRMLVNVPHIIKFAKAEASESERADVEQILKVLGVDSLGSLIGHWRVGSSTYDSKMELLLLTQGERRGLAKLLSMENTPTVPAKTASADSAMYMACNLSVPKLLDEIEAMIRQSNPEWADMMNASMEMPLPTGETVHLRKDFLDYLIGPITVDFGLAKPLGPNCLRLLIGIGQTNQDAMVRLLSNQAITQGMLQPRDLRGTQVFDAMMPPGLSVATTPDRLVIGNTRAVEGALDTKTAEPLAETEGWKRAVRLVPEKSWFTLYADNEKILESAIELARNPDAMAGAGMSVDGMILQMIVEGMAQNVQDGDVTQAKKVLKYAAPSIITVDTTPEGIRFISVKLRPKK